MMENRLLFPVRGSSGVEVGRTSRRPASPGLYSHPAMGTASDRSGASSFETMLHSAEKRYRDGGSDRRNETVKSSGHPGRNPDDVENGRKEVTSTPDGERDNLVSTVEAGVETVREVSIGRGEGEGRDSGKRAGSELEEARHRWKFHRDGPIEGGTAWRAGEGDMDSSQSVDDSDGVGPMGDRSVAQDFGFDVEDSSSVGQGSGFVTEGNGSDAEGYSSVTEGSITDGESVSPSADWRDGSSHSGGEGESGLKVAEAQVSAEGAASGSPGEITTHGEQVVTKAGPEEGLEEGEAGEKMDGSPRIEASAERRVSKASVERPAEQMGRQQAVRPLSAAGPAEEGRGPGSERTSEEILPERWFSPVPSEEHMAAEGETPADERLAGRLAAGRWRGSRGNRRVSGDRAPLSHTAVDRVTEGGIFSELAGTDRSTGTGLFLSSENRVSVPSFWSFSESGMESEEPVQTDLEEDGFDWRTFVTEIRELEEQRRDSTAVAMSRLAQLPVANISVRKHLLPGLTQQVLEAAAGRSAGGGWQKQSLVLDDGHRIQLATRRVDGVLQVKISSVDTELNRLLIQHQQEIREHLEKKCDLKLDLQFEQENFEETSSDGSAEAGFAGLSYGSDGKGSRLWGRDREKTVEKPVEKLTPVSVRSFGYNQMEWIA